MHGITALGWESYNGILTSLVIHSRSKDNHVTYSLSNKTVSIVQDYT
jgi:hypothetical protein